MTIVDDDLPAITGFTAPGGDGATSLSWGAPATGSTIDGHELRYGETLPATWTAIPSSAPGEANEDSYDVTGLTNGTAYTFELRTFEERTHANTAIGDYRLDSPAARAEVTPGITPTVGVGGRRSR